MRIDNVYRNFDPVSEQQVERFDLRIGKKVTRLEAAASAGWVAALENFDFGSKYN
jgi:hypothetical protein